MPIEILEDRIAPASILVTTMANSGPGSLRQAILDTNADGGTNSITFAVGLHGFVILKSPLPPIETNLTISVARHPSARDPIGIAGHGQFQIFDVPSSAAPVNVSISSLTLIGGSNVAQKGDMGGGALYINDYGGTVKISGCVITKNRAAGESGATVSAGIGGGIDLVSGTLDIASTTISGNVAVGGHGSTAGAAGGGARGGGLYIGDGAIVTMTNSVVTGNLAHGGAGTAGARGVNGTGAGVAGGAGGAGGGGGTAYGGGIWTYGTVTINTSTVSGNLAIGGIGGAGGVGGAGGTGSAGVLGGNGGTGGTGGFAGRAEGGGIYETGSYVLKVNNSTISGNVASGNLGGRGGAGGTAGAGFTDVKGHISRATHGTRGITLLRSSSYGGGIHSSESTITLSQDTVARNGADQGGGVFLYEPYAATMDNCTIAFNVAHQAGQGGGVWLYLGSPNTVTVISTVIGDNVTGAKGPGQDLFLYSGSITPTASLIESFTIGSVTNDGTDILNKNPLLLGLAKNGGPTLTCLPTPRSPLLGAGSNPNKLSRDQRGKAREVGGTTDIGAVEEA